MPLDEAVVADIYREHGPALRRFVAHALPDPTRVEDVVQEVILRVWRQAPEVRSMRGYLLQTARNVVIDMHRAAGRRPREVPDDEAGEGAGQARAWSVGSDMDRALDRLLVMEALARLQPDHRAVVGALYYGQLTVVEAAAALGVPEGTVKSRAFYAVRSLRAILDEMGVTR